MENTITINGREKYFNLKKDLDLKLSMDYKDTKYNMVFWAGSDSNVAPSDFSFYFLRKKPYDKAEFGFVLQTDGKGSYEARALLPINKPETLKVQINEKTDNLIQSTLAHLLN